MDHILVNLQYSWFNYAWKTSAGIWLFAKRVTTGSSHVPTRNRNEKTYPLSPHSNRKNAQVRWLIDQRINRAHNFNHIYPYFIDSSSIPVYLRNVYIDWRVLPNVGGSNHLIDRNTVTWQSKQWGNDRLSKNQNINVPFSLENWFLLVILLKYIWYCVVPKNPTALQENRSIRGITGRKLT